MKILDKCIVTDSMGGNASIEIATFVIENYHGSNTDTSTNKRYEGTNCESHQESSDKQQTYTTNSCFSAKKKRKKKLFKMG
jgi:hypothetical protein